MNNIKKNYFEIKSCNKKFIHHAFFTKKHDLTKKNIIKIKDILNIKKKKIKFINQIHSNKISFIDNKNFNKKIIADGSITRTKDICLGIITADCAPILMFDKNNKIICAIHSGWKGCLNNIIAKAVRKIKSLDKNAKIIAIVGPCLGIKNFEVDYSFRKKFIKKNYKYKNFFKYKNQKKYLFNMRGLINFQLENQKVYKKYNIKMDTYSQIKLFFSHRRARHNGYMRTGRMINIIGFSI